MSEIIMHDSVVATEHLFSYFRVFVASVKEEPKSS